MYLGSTIRSAGTSCRPHDKPLAHRVSRVKAAAARSAGTRSVSLDAARTVGHSATATTQLLIRSPRRRARARTDSFYSGARGTPATALEPCSNRRTLPERDVQHDAEAKPCRDRNVGE